MPGRKTCRFHGGTTKGAKVKSGRWAKSLGRLSKGMQDALNDPTLLDMNQLVALLRALTSRVAVRLDEGDTADLRARALALFNDALQAQTDGDILLMAEKLTALGELLREGVTEDKTIRDLGESVDRLAKVTKSAWDVKLSKKTAISAQDFVGVIGRFVDIVRNVADIETARLVADQVNLELLPRDADVIDVTQDPDSDA